MKLGEQKCFLKEKGCAKLNVLVFKYEFRIQTFGIVFRLLHTWFSYVTEQKH